MSGASSRPSTAGFSRRPTITTCTLASLVATVLGYMLIIWHYSDKAMVAFDIATLVSLALLCCVARKIGT